MKIEKTRYRALYEASQSKIDKETTSGELNAISFIGAKTLKESVDLISTGKALTDQNDKEATYAKNRKTRSSY